jgi:hypothetical protein
MSKKFSTGYNSIADAIKDKFAKVGGEVRAMSVLETGWYQICQRKEMNVKNARLRELLEKDPRFADLKQSAVAQMGQIRKKA